MIDRVRNGIYFDDELNPYTEKDARNELSNLLSQERYEECVIIREYLKRFEHEKNYCSERT